MSSHTWPNLLNRLVAGENLSSRETAWAMDQVMSGEATPSQIAALAVGLRAKGETPDEVVGMADGMLANARRLDVAGPAVDIVGTGGDRSSWRCSPSRSDRHRGRGGAGGQARQPVGVVEVRRGRCAGGARGRRRARTGRRGPLRHRARHRVLLRPGVPPGTEIRRPDPS